MSLLRKKKKLKMKRSRFYSCRSTEWTAVFLGICSPSNSRYSLFSNPVVSVMTIVTNTLGKEFFLSLPLRCSSIGTHDGSSLAGGRFWQVGIEWTDPTRSRGIDSFIEHLRCDLQLGFNADERCPDEISRVHGWFSKEWHECRQTDRTCKRCWSQSG